MLPKVILHNTISLNGAITGFQADMGLHYGIAMKHGAQAFLVGAGSILSANEEIPENVRYEIPEKISDPKDKRPYWVVVDSGGRLIHCLQYYRQMEYIKDIMVMTSEATPYNYRKFLHDNRFTAIQAGVGHVNIKKALELLYEDHDIKTVVTDCGPTLAAILLEQNLVSELSLILSPTLLPINIKTRGLFDLYGSEGVRTAGKEWTLAENTTLPEGHVHLRYINPVKITS
jgi:2,5-diamino-6-(ribosylamino)-4(3H)-pyrimidinone 5'-phosphate reductase